MSDLDSKSYLEIAEETLAKIKALKIYPTIVHDNFVNSLQVLAKKNDPNPGPDSARMLEIIQELIVMRDAYIVNRSKIIHLIHMQMRKDAREACRIIESREVREAREAKEDQEAKEAQEISEAIEASQKKDAAPSTRR